MSTSRTLLIMAGGTGGHIFPALAVAQAVRAKGWKVVWLGAQGAMETRIVPQHDIPLETLAITGVRGKGLARKLVQPWVQLKALCKSFSVIFRHRPDVAIGFGGFTGFAGGLATRLLWLPLVVHEQNSVAGLTNKTLAKIASRVLFAFPSAFPARDGCVGNPVRGEITGLPEPLARFAERSGALRLLVVGGSLGAQVFNEQVPKALALLPAEQRPQVIHQAGEKHIEALKANYAAAGVDAECVAFIGDMANAYADADLVLCRAGALTVAELACVGAASVLVPFPSAVDDHQTGNARYLSDAGAGLLLPQAQFSAERFAALLRETDRASCLAMAERARQLAKPDATLSVVQVLEELAA
ncbi:UDP-N-acetylglucosamine-N-acetylmuramylpentapeptide N-acetylglucosamine transferase [Andreprevotia lacus DSM 23236]|jgi:UDP-N-acetylglucosamine--N-acetylmuramyl-(pentapeptide) pyrophosphoryl-undecaprenol N-acetylglucosamine transferase|uniref:UDP-N-acetylglucosamine--N-acetylmuramyl-(pentapeptide) pyrophosphoryl-undecaprenol N-acetylglucosamine transferase n=1 Tax=Andreprevotia lacus DSM 23236 TaxID=1121001 RepID=A0A1W1XRS0_9NEIS|nr:undecaprenyldiphospho-muramoylpentapeptide beta-N-acetylglucosaminyltransferase [Andreprevotia lacus]SMC26669.1 UDP-N-acetylglucosamine-N-acetylmuramylpentapeptide N-acetylglucosamine transferase [Andreprevotia lacus DSM 23236]